MKVIKFDYRILASARGFAISYQRYELFDAEQDSPSPLWESYYVQSFRIKSI